MSVAALGNNSNLALLTYNGFIPKFDHSNIFGYLDRILSQLAVKHGVPLRVFTLFP